MQIPVLVRGNIREIASLNPVRLIPGRWKMVVEGHADTIFFPLPGSLHELERASTMQVEVISPGTEPVLTIYFEKLP